jgi:hypothetical protein
MKAPNEPTEIEVVTRFLHRFADLMSNGSNSEHLLRAAKLIEASVKRASEAEDLLRQERSNGARLKAQLSAISREGHVLVPVSVLRLAASQFSTMARGFAKSGDVVSQVMCEASATTLGGVLGANAHERDMSDAL